MEETKLSDVGGYPLIATANQDGISIVPILTQNPKNLDQYALAVNGYNLYDMDKIEGFGFGLKAMGIGVEKVAGRDALREKGIDPDSDKITNTIQKKLLLRNVLKLHIPNLKTY